MIILEGNLLDTPFEIIAHQVNCMGVMNGGIAKQIREKYPVVYTEYKRNLQPPGSSEYMFGRSQIIFCARHTIFNIFGQFKYGTDRQYTDYNAVKSAFEDALDTYRGDNDHQITIAIPHGFGCGLAGGDWDTMVNILETLEKQENVVFVAYKLPKGGLLK